MVTREPLEGCFSPPRGVFPQRAAVEEVSRRVPTTVTQGDRFRPRDLTPTDQQGLRDLWSVYGTDYDEIMREAENALSDDAEAAPQQSMLEERRLKSKELLGKAMLEGDWEPYLAGLHDQGVGYARMGLSFGGWLRVLGVVRPSILRRVRAAFASEPERLYAVLSVIDQWLDAAMSMIADSFLEAKEQAIQQQQEAILELSTPVLSLTHELLLMPVVGVIDSHRCVLDRDGALAVADFMTGSDLATIGREVPRSSFSALVVDRQRNELVTGAWTGRVDAWDTASGKLVRRIGWLGDVKEGWEDSMLASLAHKVARGNMWIVPEAGQGEEIDFEEFLNGLTGMSDSQRDQFRRQMQKDPLRDAVHDLVVTADGNIVAAVGGGCIRAWNAATGAKLATAQTTGPHSSSGMDKFI